jgi:hypothetical protein
MKRRMESNKRISGDHENKERKKERCVEDNKQRMERGRNGKKAREADNM